MNIIPLVKEYEKLVPGLNRLYVVPLINYKLKNSDYLYLLYKDILENKSQNKIEIVSLSASAHPVFFLSRFTKGKSILHYHWFEVHDFKSLIGMIWKIFWLTLYKLIGGKLIWTVHNTFPHSNNYKIINTFCRKYLAIIADKLHVHCYAAIEIMAPLLGVNHSKFFVIENPYYPATILPKNETLNRLIQKYSLTNINVENEIYLIFGAIADYKGIIETAELFKTKFKDKTLLIAGYVKQWDKHYYKKLIEQTSDSKNIFVLGDKIVPDEDLSLFYNSADCIIFNYKDVLTSGGVMMALSYNKKTIAPSLGCIKEIQNKNLHLFNSNDLGSLEDLISSKLN